MGRSKGDTNTETTTDPGYVPLTDLRSHGYARTWPQLSNQLIAMNWADADVKQAQGCYQLSIALFGDLVRSNEAPFLSHTVGTASVLAVHGAPAQLVSGALLHAAYTHGRYSTPLDTPLEREHRLSISRQVGPEIELLVRNYRRYRPELMPVPSSASEYDEDHAAVLLMRAANHLEEHLDFGLLYAEKVQRQGNSVLAHAKVLLPSLGYQRLLAEIEAAERLMEEATTLPEELRSAGARSRQVSG